VNQRMTEEAQDPAQAEMKAAAGEVPLLSRRQWALLAGVGVASAAAGGGWAWWRGRPTAAEQDAGSAFWDRSFETPVGKNQPLSQWKGQVLVVNFWATWCPPCRKEIPDFSAASEALADQPVQFIGISIDSLEKVRAFDDEFKVPYPLLIAGADILTLAAGFGNDARALPFTVVIDREGKARHIKLGTLNRDELERKIRAPLAS